LKSHPFFKSPSFTPLATLNPIPTLETGYSYILSITLSVSQSITVSSGKSLTYAEVMIASWSFSSISFYDYIYLTRSLVGFPTFIVFDCHFQKARSDHFPDSSGRDDQHNDVTFTRVWRRANSCHSCRGPCFPGQA
jgi:hypothetical protein